LVSGDIGGVNCALKRLQVSVLLAVMLGDLARLHGRAPGLLGYVSEKLHPSLLAAGVAGWSELLSGSLCYVKRIA
jgi:hypothetical protein